VPERLIVEAAERGRVGLDELQGRRRGREVVLDRPDAVEGVLRRAIAHWRNAVPKWARLNLKVEHQSQTNWCWAAVAVSVSRFYSSDSSWTQCELVNAETGLTTCCHDGSSSACDTTHGLGAALTRAEVFDHIEPRSVEYDVVRREIDAGRPIGWRIAWPGNGGHFAIIEGYRTVGEEWVSITDPWLHETDAPVTTLTSGNYGGGRWSHTYFTQRPPPPLRDRPLGELRLPVEVWERIRTDERLIVGGGEDT
jgi:hypothetical protein